MHQGKTLIFGTMQGLCNEERRVYQRPAFTRRQLALGVAVVSLGIGLLRLAEGMLAGQPVLVTIGLIVLAGSLVLLAAVLWWPGWG